MLPEKLWSGKGMREMCPSLPNTAEEKSPEPFKGAFAFRVECLDWHILSLAQEVAAWSEHNWAWPGAQLWQAEVNFLSSLGQDPVPVVCLGLIKFSARCISTLSWAPVQVPPCGLKWKFNKGHICFKKKKNSINCEEKVLFLMSAVKMNIPSLWGPPMWPGGEKKVKWPQEELRWAIEALKESRPVGRNKIQPQANKRPNKQKMTWFWHRPRALHSMHVLGPWC